MNVRKFLFIVSTGLAGCSTTKIVEADCKLYQQGNFIHHAYNNSGIGHWKKMSSVINRNDTTETIITTLAILPSADTSYYNIKWINPCTCEETYLSGNNHWLDSMIRNKQISGVSIRTITKASNLYYIERHDKQKDTIWVQPKN